MRVEIIGSPPRPPFLLVCNHLSYTDIPALRLAANGNFVAKSDIKNWFVAGRIIRDMGAIFINRRNRRDILRAGSEITERLDQGEGVIIFPEGTSTKGEEILPFNSSFLNLPRKQIFPFLTLRSLTKRQSVNRMPAMPSAGGTMWFLSSICGAFLRSRGIYRCHQFRRKTARLTPTAKNLAHELREKVRKNLYQRFDSGFHITCK